MTIDHDHDQDREDMDETQLSVDTFEICIDLIRQTDLAILCNDGDREVWIPKSVIKDPPVAYLEETIRNTDFTGKHPSGTITIMEWFAIKEGFI